MAGPYKSLLSHTPQGAQRGIEPAPYPRQVQELHSTISASVQEIVPKKWHKLKKFIITGCILPMNIFTFAVNMLVKSAEVSCRGPLTRSDALQWCMRQLTIAFIRGGEKLTSAPRITSSGLLATAQDWEATEIPRNCCRNGHKMVQISVDHTLRPHHSLGGLHWRGLQDKS